MSMGDVVAFRRPSQGVDRCMTPEGALAQARKMHSYLGPAAWRRWCERRGLVVEEGLEGLVARIPDDDEEDE